MEIGGRRWGCLIAEKDDAGAGHEIYSSNGGEDLVGRWEWGGRWLIEGEKVKKKERKKEKENSNLTN